MKNKVSTGLRRATVRLKRSKMNQDLGIEKKTTSFDVLGDLDSTRGSAKGGNASKTAKNNDKTYDIAKDPLITTDHMGAAIE